MVTTYGDTTYCQDIKLKALSVTCKTAKGKEDILNENVRRIFMPVKDSEWSAFFDAYSTGGKKSVYPYSPRQVQAVVKNKVYPRFFDLKPLDSKKNFWARGLFEILVQNNGYKLCKLKSAGTTGATLAGEANNLDKYVVFKEYEADGVVLTRANYRKELVKVVKGCDAAEKALQDESVNHLKDVPGFLTLFARCN